MVLVKNNRPRLHSIALPSGATIQLVPGVNQVSDADWAGCAAHPMVQTHLKLGDLEVVGEKANDDNPLRRLSPAKAVKLVSETYDARLLAAWKAGETRGPVLEAIDLQLVMIEEETKPKRESKLETPSEA